MVSASLFFAVIFDRSCDYVRAKLLRYRATARTSAAKYEKFSRNKSRRACTRDAILVVAIVVIVVVLIVSNMVVFGIPRANGNSARMSKV